MIFKQLIQEVTGWSIFRSLAYLEISCLVLSVLLPPPSTQAGQLNGTNTCFCKYHIFSPLPIIHAFPFHCGGLALPHPCLPTPYSSSLLLLPASAPKLPGSSVVPPRYDYCILQTFIMFRLLISWEYFSSSVFYDLCVYLSFPKCVT